MKISTLLSLLTFFSSFIVYGQNLVSNYSFENQNYAPCELSEELSDILVDWDSPSGKEGDVYSTNIPSSCYQFQPNSTYNGPISFKGTESPSEGNSFAAIWIYTISGHNHREYIRGELTQPLEEGKIYKVRFKISLADYMESSVSELGIAFMESTDIQRDGDLIVVEPQLKIRSILGVTDGWAEFDKTFVSDGSHNYFIIGNFNSDEDTETNPNPSASGESSTYGAYYYFDEVSVEPVTVNSVSDNTPSSTELYPIFIKDIINYKSDEFNLSSYQIINNIGQTVQDSNLDNPNFGQVDCSNLPAGIYYFLSKNKNGRILSTSKFIKAE